MILHRAASLMLDVATRGETPFLQTFFPHNQAVQPPAASPDVQTPTPKPEIQLPAKSGTISWMGSRAVTQLRSTVGYGLARALMEEIMMAEPDVVLTRFADAKHKPKQNILWLRDYLNPDERKFFDEVLYLTTGRMPEDVTQDMLLGYEGGGLKHSGKKARHAKLAALPPAHQARFAALCVAFIKRLEPYEKGPSLPYFDLTCLGEAGFQGLAALTRHDFTAVDRFDQRYETIYFQLLPSEFRGGDEAPPAVFKSVHVKCNYLAGKKCVSLLNAGVPIENFFPNSAITNGIGDFWDKSPTAETIATLKKHVLDKTVQQTYRDNALHNPLAPEVLRYQVALQLLAKIWYVRKDDAEIQAVFDGLFAQGGLVARVVIAALLLQHQYIPAEAYLKQVKTSDEFAFIINHPGTLERESSAIRAAIKIYNDAVHAKKFDELAGWWHIIKQLAPRSSLALHTLFHSYRRRDHAEFTERVDIFISQIAEQYNVATLGDKKRAAFLWRQIEGLVPKSRLPLDTLFMERPRIRQDSQVEIQ